MLTSIGAASVCIPTSHEFLIVLICFLPIFNPERLFMDGVLMFANILLSLWVGTVR